MSVLEEYNGDSIEEPGVKVNQELKSTNESSSYRQQAIATIKMACQDVIDRIESIIPQDTQGAFEIYMSMKIPTMTENKFDIPSFTITMSSYPARETVQTYINQMKQKL